MNRRLAGGITTFTAAAAFANVAADPVQDRAREAIAARFAGCTISKVVDTGRVAKAARTTDGTVFRSLVTVELDPHASNAAKRYERKYAEDDAVAWYPFSVSARMVTSDAKGNPVLGNRVGAATYAGEMDTPTPGGPSTATLAPRITHPEGTQIAVFANTKVMTSNQEGVTTSTASKYCGAIVLGAEKLALGSSVFVAVAPQQGWQKMTNPPQFPSQAPETYYAPWG